MFTKVIIQGTETKRNEPIVQQSVYDGTTPDGALP
jgi:hypothetical protein